MRSPKRTSAKRSEEGAVMLVVMLILLTVTALAGVSFQAAQYDLRSAGNNRSAVQTQYVAEAAMSTSLSWIDATSLDRSLMRAIDVWNKTTPPNMVVVGEPALTALNRADSSRTQWKQQEKLTTVTLPPLTVPGAKIGVNEDPVGTFGPRVPLHPGVEETKNPDVMKADYVVDMYDCRQLTGVGSPGSQVNQGGSGTIQEIQLFCVVTARGRSFVWNGERKTWRTADNTAYVLNRFTLAHDMRGSVVSPPIVQ